MAIYLKYEGIKGNITAEGYSDYIALSTVNLGVGRGISMESGNMANRESTRPTLSEIVITKPADTSATALFKESVTGNGGKEVTIKFVRTGSDAIQEFMEYVLTDVMISGYSLSGEAEDEPKETIKLSYTKIMIKYNDFDSSNASGNPMRVGYDLSLGKSL